MLSTLLAITQAQFVYTARQWLVDLAGVWVLSWTKLSQPRGAGA